MVMPAVCQLSLALVAFAFAGSDDWEEVAHGYSDKFYQGPANGEFAQYLHHANDLSHFSQDRLDEAKTGAERFSQDRVDQGKRDANWFVTDHAPESLLKKASGDDKSTGEFAVALAAAPVEHAEEKTTKESSEKVAEKGQKETSRAASPAEEHEQAVHRAEAAIQELQEWDSKLKADLQDKNFSARVARSIVSRAKADTVQQRLQLAGSFNSALDAVSHSSNATELNKAEHTARESAKEFLYLDRRERKTMRETLLSIERRGKGKARALWKRARDAARRAYHQGMTAARAQRKAGVQENIYERAMGDAESVSERLSGHAEHAAEHAEDLLERQEEAVEHDLEEIMDKLQDEAQRQHSQRLHDVSDRAQEVRATHFAHSGEAGTAHNAGEDSKEKAKANSDGESKEHGGHPSAFLARNEPAGLSIGSVAFCVLATGLLAALLVVRFRKEGSSQNMENPLLA